MKLQTIIASAAILLASAGSASAGERFIESRTSANLLLNGEDSVISTVGVGATYLQENGLTDVYGGVGYSAGERGNLALQAGVRTMQYVGKQIFVEAEVDATYRTGSDKLEFTPEVRVRKYL